MCACYRNKNFGPTEYGGNIGLQGGGGGGISAFGMVLVFFLLISFSDC